MKRINITIDEREFDVEVVCDNDDLETGLQNIANLDSDKGMLFVFEDEEDAAMWMKDTHIPLDIIFIDEDWEVLRVTEGEPLSENLISEPGTKYVLELNVRSGVKVGDYVDLDEIELEELLEKEPEEVVIMVVIDKDGKSQMDLEGGERIFSRPNTKTLIKMARRAERSKRDKDYKALGKKVFTYLKTQDGNEVDTVEIPQ